MIASTKVQPGKQKASEIFYTDLMRELVIKVLGGRTGGAKGSR